MKSIWKWILGILLVLVVVGAIGAAAFVWRNHMISVTSFRAMPFDRNGGNPIPRGFDGWRRGPMMGFRGGGFGLFGPFFFLGGLVKLIFFGALLYGAYWLGKRNARVVFDSSTSSVPRASSISPEATDKPDVSQRE